MIELDIRLSKDGVPMVFHDSSLEKRTDGCGKVQNFTAAELQRFRLRGSNPSGICDERIPTFKETLGTIPENVWVNVHLKGSGFDPHEGLWKRWFRTSKETLPGGAVAQVIATSQREHQAFLTCGPENAAAARQVLPGILICHNRRSHVENTQFIQEAISLRVRFAQFGEHRSYTPELIRQLDKEGIWTTYACADDLATTQRLLVDGIRFPVVNNIHALAPHLPDLARTPPSEPPPTHKPA